MDKRIYIIDRIEDGIATLIAEDNGDVVSVEVVDSDFPKVNDAVVIENGAVRFVPREEYTGKAEENKNRLKNLFGRNTGEVK